MRLLQKSKRIISAGLSVIMLSGMMTGLTGKEVYAAANQVILDLGDGPKFRSVANVDLTTNGYGSTSMDAAFSGNQYTIIGSASAPLTNAGAFAGVATETFGSGTRPTLPEYSATAWPGYELAGWYDEDEQKVEHLPYAFQLTGTTLKAKWRGSSNKQSMLRVRHYIEKTGNTINLTDTLNSNDTRVIALRPSSWASDLYTTQTASGTPIIKTPYTDIPGYKVISSAMSDAFNKRADGSTNYGTTAALKKENNKVTGLMPNHDVTVDYKYGVDTSRNFTLRVQYVSATDGTTLKAEDTYSANVGATVTGTIPDRLQTLYVLQNDTMANMVTIQGLQATNLNTTGIMSLQFVNGEAEGADMLKTPYFNTTTGNFSFKMPNHNITLRYKYNVDTSVTRPVTVQYLDNHGVAIPSMNQEATDASGSKQVPTTYDVALPKLDGYMYPPNVNVEPTAAADFSIKRTVSAGLPDPAIRKFQYKVTATEPAGGRKIKVNYSEDLGDKTFWTKVSFEKQGVSSYTVPGATSWKKDPRDAANAPAPHTLATILGTPGSPATALPTPGTDYLFDSVYVKSDPTKKYTSLGDEVNLKTVANGGIADDQGNVTLVVNFKKDPTKWARVEFKAGPGGSLPGARNFPSKNINDTLASFAPTPTPRTNYQFDGWFVSDDSGNPISRVTTENPMIPGSGAFPSTMKVSNTDVANDGTAKFVYVALFKGIDPRPGVYVAPVLDAGIGSDGLGTVTVNGASDRRRYILTDLAGNIIANMSGSALGTGKFTALPVGRRYNVYEVEDTDTTATGNISAVATKSAPAEVLVPVISGAPTYGAGTNQGTKKVTVGSPAPNTEYALVNSSTGEVILPTTPVVFDNLQPNTNFVLVARPAGDTTPFDAPHVLENGTAVYTPAGAATKANYALTVSGGQITSATRSGNPIDGFTAGMTSFDKFQKGDRITITAPTQNNPTQKWIFDKWIVNIGTLSAFSPVQSTAQFNMPGNDLVLNSTYRYDSSVPGSQAPDLSGFNSTLSYSPMNGKFSIDPASALSYKDSIMSVPGSSDNVFIASGQVGLTHESSKKVTYTVKFTQRSPLASESNAIKALSSNPDLVRFAFAVDVNLTRKFNTTTVALDPGIAIPAMDIYAKLDDSNRGGYDYQLYKVAGGTVTAVSTNPGDLAALSGESFVIPGVQPNAGESYVLAYKRQNIVTIVDTKSYLPITTPGGITTTTQFRVPEGAALEDVAAYTALGLDPNTDITAPSGKKYQFKGLYKDQGFTAGNKFSTSATVREAMNLYTKYEETADPARDAAIDALDAKIAEIDALLADPNISAAARGQLSAAKAAADAIKAKVNPLATIAEINNVKDTTVQAAIDSANASRTIGNAKAELNNSIGLSNTLLADTTKPVSADDKQAIEDLRDRASLLLTDPSATQAQIDAMRQQLNDLIDQAEARADKVVELNTVINELRGLAPNSKLNNADRDAINQAIAAAESLRDKTSNPADPSQVQATIAELLAKKAELEQLVRDARAKINNSGSGGSGGGSSSGGGGGGGSSSGGGGPKAKNATVAGINYKTYRNETEGDWRQNSNGSWNFVLKNSAEPLKSSWAAIVYGSGEGQSLATYAFDAQGNMRTGWIQDDKGLWYYMSDTQGSSYGAMVKGWIFSAGKWYYLSPVTGSMMTGWQEVEGKWYLLAGDGSLYVNTTTPDGFPVDANGVWLRETP